jgi:hypothetical protein
LLLETTKPTQLIKIRQLTTVARIVIGNERIEIPSSLAIKIAYKKQSKPTNRKFDKTTYIW